MIVKTLRQPNRYADSVALMTLARELGARSGVEEAAAVMGTPANLDLLAEAGLLDAQVKNTGPGDLIVAVRATNEAAADQALRIAEEWLRSAHSVQGQGDGGSVPYRTSRSAARDVVQSNLAVISVPGPYARLEAQAALLQGQHVFLFSDNVSLDDEVALKRFAQERGLLLMGPDCGTAMIGGLGLGFTNAVRRGPVGVVGASGTGMQEVMVRLDRRGIGISQAIGTGGRDLSQAVGGIMMLQGLRTLQADPNTSVIVLISKPPAAEVAAHIVEAAAQSQKPAVVCFLGGDSELARRAGALPARTLEEAALQASLLVAGRHEGMESDPYRSWLDAARRELPASNGKIRRFVRGLFSGGTLAEEALLLLQEQLGPIWSNAPLDPACRLPDSHLSRDHTIVDLGADEFTVGRPHPMIDPTQRVKRLERELADPAVKVILFDVVLGYSGHPNPAGPLADAIGRRDKEIVAIASVCGTENDPQGLQGQEEQLRHAGVFIAPTNASAAKLASFAAA